MLCFVSFLCSIIWGIERQNYPARLWGFAGSLAIAGTVIWHQMEGPEGRDHLEAHPYRLGVAGGMGCPYGVTLAIVGVWQGPADGSL